MKVRSVFIIFGVFSYFIYCFSAYLLQSTFITTSDHGILLNNSSIYFFFNNRPMFRSFLVLDLIISCLAAVKMVNMFSVSMEFYKETNVNLFYYVIKFIILCVFAITFNFSFEIMLAKYSSR